MKSIRIIIFLTVISMFTTSPYIAAEARDCSNPEGFHQKLMCKKFNLKMPTFKKKPEDSSESANTSENTEENKKGVIGNVWEKIKNFGGKKMGEPG